MNTQQIFEKYKVQHTNLGKQRDAPDKDTFDQQHREIWHNCDVELKVRRDELASIKTSTEAEVRELGELKMMPLEPTSSHQKEN